MSFPTLASAAWSALVRGAPRFVRDPVYRSRSAIVLAAVFVCLYAASVVTYVVTLPDIGVRSAFSPTVNHFFKEFLYPVKQKHELRHDDRITAIGGKRIEDWPQLLRRLVELRQRDEPKSEEAESALYKLDTIPHLRYQGVEIIRVEYEPADNPGKTEFVWCKLGRSPLETLLPTVLWFFIKAGLFVVGALVFWQRPQEQSARLFFLLTVVSCGAYLGGYHWQGIATQPALLVVFMTTSILLPPVSLHFFFVFPRPKPFYVRRPWTTLAALYGPPVFFLVVLLGYYGGIRWVNSLRGGSHAELLQTLLDGMVWWIYRYFWVALAWYLLSIVCLVYSYRTAADLTERNQVKWILFGATAALVPMAYSLYLALLEQEKFGGGDATWPMFCASLFVTIAFTISITRYRLMELDKLISSGAAYLSLTAMAALVYYGLVIVGVLLLGSKLIAVPTFAQAAGVGGTVLVLVVLLDLARGRLKKALDRHFHREKIQLDRTLQRMSQAIAQLVDPPTLARRLLSTTTELLGVERGAVYLREGDPPLYRVADSLGAAPPLTELSSGCPLVEELQSRGRLCLHGHAPGSNGTSHAPAFRQLHFLGGEVAFALSHEDQMLAILVLGQRSVDAYTPEDVNLLSAFVQVTALALVSSEGGRTIETLNRDLKAKVEKIAEQQRRISALQSQLVRRSSPAADKDRGSRMEDRESSSPATGSGDTVAADQDPRSSILDPRSSILDSRSQPGGIIGSSPALGRLMELVRKVAGSSSAVLLRGESGTGKELLACAVHECSPRAARPFIKVHCAALAPGLLESELFGHVKGAYTGAVRDRPGRFELANGGTLFLDEIGDVSWEVQTKLLRVLQENIFERVGSSEPMQVDVRIIAATHQHLETLIKQGRFREDLYYRLSVLPVAVPPLRERREDIPELVQHFLVQYGARSGKPNLQIDDEAMLLLKAADWPGNIRELENVIQRAAIIAEGPMLTCDDLPEELLRTEPLEEPAGDALEAPRGVEAERADREQREREQLVRTLASTKGNKAEAARALGLARSTFLSRLKKYGLN